MLKLSRQCATIQITVVNANGVMVFDESCSSEAYGYLEHCLQRALEHERRVIEGTVSNTFFDRINQLQKEIARLKGEGRAPAPVELQGEKIIDVPFKITDQREKGYDA